jgi:hypothetical protein
MIHRQSFPPQPLLLPNMLLPLPQQQERSSMIQIMELHPPSLHPHPPPQFVAAKSLIVNPPNFSYSVLYDIVLKV